MRIVKRKQSRRADLNLSDAWERYLFGFCNRLGVLTCLGYQNHLSLMDDHEKRDGLIRQMWARYGDDLSKKWAAEHHGETPAVVKYIDQFPTADAYRLIKRKRFVTQD